ncbi:UNVERIFIED_CONTAM: Pentatricopeptide repeat-containing protein, chloroplastic [Sesamum radiatum]|uniref:Pentatricopeptide repeat-containing protein, chloroplastic n=1 Tax=Sesamum radiatum TaxID=300843 RepID=A0AAW2PJ13_SESRA
MPMRNVVSWIAIISVFVEKGDLASALQVLKDMRKTGEEINIFTVSSVLAACANPSKIQPSPDGQSARTATRLTKRAD